MALKLNLFFFDFTFFNMQEKFVSCFLKNKIEGEENAKYKK